MELGLAISWLNLFEKQVYFYVTIGTERPHPTKGRFL
ncbi:hypothetical protein SAMN05421821_109107 [Mucilaginibacter lappiensis]|uniref:Uncharacterized protein n=1 Tax=Mucilaginibacter lappiensis TaxID=354630 RepID=A0ABR6PNW2_9SPHI|nr:hypothetical protein [Mucilaginibacter lappiensis]SIR61595.1 hypothetical protein SAMN05421821_109107 [Mucilaginibacter lappiensis]